jgi:hypothetical protein
MEDDFEHTTQPAGDLDPPDRKPPTAVGTAEAPRPDDAGGAKVRALIGPGSTSWLGKWVNTVLDVVDIAAEVARDAVLSVTRR